ncbi:MAG: hypothetical protein BroJett021_40530 [Chloroflexota bacterium]|nr:MAG: hypothetical protein BroJett021_40530 [Chloroflexota bacterium]
MRPPKAMSRYPDRLICSLATPYQCNHPTPDRKKGIPETAMDFGSTAEMRDRRKQDIGVRADEIFDHLGPTGRKLRTPEYKNDHFVIRHDNKVCVESSQGTSMLKIEIVNA